MCRAGGGAARPLASLRRTELNTPHRDTPAAARMYLHVCILYVRMYIFMYKCILRLWLCCMYVCMYVCMCV